MYHLFSGSIFSQGSLTSLPGLAYSCKNSGGAWTALAIAVATIAIFALFGLHILNDGLYEFRTVMAMSLRTTVWVFISLYAYRRIILKSEPDNNLFNI